MIIDKNDEFLMISSSDDIRIVNNVEEVEDFCTYLICRDKETNEIYETNKHLLVDNNPKNYELIEEYIKIKQKMLSVYAKLSFPLINE